MPKVSVVMPAYNAEKYIGEAIDSILSQTFRDYEFIIIDDGSTDRTVDIIQSYQDSRIRFCRNEQNMGVVRTLNRGLDLATGEYIARMDSDDISVPERLEKQVAYMDQHMNTIVCGSNILLFNSDGVLGKGNYPQTDKAIKTALFFGSSFAHPTVCIRRAVIEKYHLRYDYQFEKVEDYHFWVVLRNYGDYCNIQEPLLNYRKHASQVCVTASDIQKKGKLEISHRILPEIGIIESTEQEIVVDAFENEHFTKEKLRTAERLFEKMLENRSERTDQTQLHLILKSKLIELAMNNGLFLGWTGMRIVGWKAAVYVNVNNIVGK